MARPPAGPVLALFDRPFRWRAEAAVTLGLTGTALAAALSPGPSYPAVLRTIRRSLPEDASVIVDVGSGLAGASCWLAASTSAHVIAVEPARGARTWARRLFPHVSVVDGDASSVPLPRWCADAVTALNVTSLLDDLEPMLREARRLLRPGGVLAIADLFSSSDVDVIASPNTFRSQRSVIRAMESAGFTLRDVACGAPTPHPRWARLSRLVDATMRRQRRSRVDRDVLARCEEDHRHLDQSISSHALVGGCVVATSDC